MQRLTGVSKTQVYSSPSLYVFNTARQAPLLARTIGSMALEDPLLFTVQTARRLPKRMRDAFTPSAPPMTNALRTPAAQRTLTALRALAEFVSDHPK